MMIAPNHHDMDRRRAAWADGPPGPSPNVTPLYFGPEASASFGWLHAPVGEASGIRVVLCPPLGYEGLFAHPTFRRTAESLADAGAIVLRMDYAGTGDSAGTDEDPARVSAWVASIESAVHELTRRAPAEGPVVLVAMRAGALLATAAAAAVGGVDGIVLWAPAPCGRAFVREQYAFAQTAHATASRDRKSDRGWGDRGFEANGTVFTTETVDALGSLDLWSARPSTSRVLLLDREDIPTDPGGVAAWEERGVHVDVVSGARYSELMQPPMSLTVPDDAVAHVTRWVYDLGAETRLPAAPDESPSPPATMGEGAVERPVWYDRGLFGILTEPVEGPTGRVLILLNNAHGNRTGPAGMYAWAARRLATESDVSTMRIDVAGVGDSVLPPSRPEHHCYALDSIEDVLAAVRFVRSQGYEDVSLGGLCSGAYLAWHSALAAPDEVDGVVLINNQTFEWNEGDSLDVSPLDNQYETDHYMQSVRSLDKWKKLLRGGVDLRYVTAVAVGAARRTADASLQRLRTRLAFTLPGTGPSIVSDADSLISKGVRLDFVFSSGDPGVTNLHRAIGGHMGRLVEGGAFSVQEVDGCDHSFTPRWARAELTRILCDVLSRRESADPASRSPAG